MTQKRKSLSEGEIRTFLAVVESFKEQNHYRYDEMNRTMGNITIEEMDKLYYKLDRWCNPEKYNNEI